MKHQILPVTQKQMRRALAPSIGQKIRRGAGIIILGAASWLFYHAMLPSQASAQDRKAKAQTEQPSQQEQLRPNERRILLQPVDAVADSSAIRQLNERYIQREQAAGNPNPVQLKIVGKTPVFQVDMSVLDEKNIKIGGNVGVTLYFLGPAKLNTNDAIKVNREGQFAKGSIWRTICIGGYIFIGVTE